MLILDLIISFGLVFISVKKFGRLFNPFTLEAYFPITFIIVPQLVLLFFDEKAKTYFYSDVAILIYILAMFMGSMINVKSYSIKGIQNVKFVNSFNVGLFILCVIPVIPILISFDLSINGIRNFYEKVITTEYASFFELSKVALYFIIFYKLIYKKRFTIGFFIFFPFVFFYGSRFVILDFIIYLCVFLEEYNSISVRKIVLIGCIGASIILFYSYFQRSDSKQGLYSMVSNYFDLYKNQSFIIQQILTNKMNYYYGEIYASSFLKYIPRILWTEKPHAFGFAILNYRFFPDEAVAGYFPSFGLGTLFADFGFVGLGIFGFVTGFVKRYFYAVFLKSKNNISFFLYVLPLTVVNIAILSWHLILDKTTNTILQISLSKVSKEVTKIE